MKYADYHIAASTVVKNKNPKFHIPIVTLKKVRLQLFAELKLVTKKYFLNSIFNNK